MSRPNSQRPVSIQKPPTESADDRSKNKNMASATGREHNQEAVSDVVKRKKIAGLSRKKVTVVGNNSSKTGI